MAEMTIVKEVEMPKRRLDPDTSEILLEGTVTCCIRWRGLTYSVEHIRILAFTANEDFPDLRESEMRVRQYDGETTRGFFGIDFLVPPESVPDSYKRVEKLDFYM